MSSITVVCPHCGKELKLRDRSKLGQKGKCPGCAKSFVLQVWPQEEVQLELADAAIPVGTAAQWVPDEPATKTSRQPAAAGGFPAVQAGTATVTPGGPILGCSPGEDDGVRRLREIRRRNAQRRNMGILFGGLVALGVGGAVWALSSYWKPAPAAPVGAVATSPAAALPANGAVASAAPSPTAAADGPQGAVMPSVFAAADGSVVLPHQDVSSPHRRRDNADLVTHLAPQRGGPVELTMVPSGMNVVLHLRPAQLWSNDAAWQEVLYSLTPDVTDWIAAQLKQHCRRDPQQIEECLIGLRLGATGTAPEWSSVVYLAQEEKLSDLIDEFRGERLSEDGPRVHVAPPYAYLIRDTKTVAIAPQADAFELPEYIREPNSNTTAGIYQLLNLTDRDRVFTVVFEVDDVKRHADQLFSEKSLPVFRQMLNWFGDDVETVAWSVGLDEDSVLSDLIVRPRAVANSSRVATELLHRLDTLPRELQGACLKMYPATKGFQALIGRLPAMMEAFRQATIPTVEPRHVRLTTVLPRKAAPNLALGTILAWHQSTLTDFSASTAAPAAVAEAAPSTNLPDKVEDRLKTVFDGEFSQPFQDAVAFIASECKVQIEIDGNALKDAGFTKNMPLKVNMGRVSGLEAFRRIVLYDNYKPPVPEKRLCIVIDEAAKTVTVTTEAFAQANGQKIYPLVKE